MVLLKLALFQHIIVFGLQGTEYIQLTNFAYNIPLFIQDKDGSVPIPG